MLLKCWVALCALFVVAGWVLSAAGQLNAYAYAAVSGATLVVILALVRRQPIRWRLPLRRFKRPLPLAYAILGFIALVGGALYSPNNYEGVTFRLPRLAYWLAAGHWTWISGASEKMNYSSANFEWLSAPLFLFTHSDRLLFLLNFIPYLFLPGLLFSTYRMLGVPGRVAWSWMWALPAAYCYVLQAGSIAVDAMGAVLVLASLHLGLRAARTRKVSEAWLALLAIALATGIEGTNLPLVLPCLVALWPARRLLQARPFASSGILAAALLVSFLPTAVLNHHFTGDWNGYGPYTNGLRVHNPLARMVANTLRVSAQMLQPPLLPGAHALDSQLVEKLPHAVNALLKPDFSQFELQLGELPQEEVSGFGLVVSLLLIVSLIGRLFVRGKTVHNVDRDQNRTATLIMAASGVAFLLYRGPVGCEATARTLAPYFPLLLPPLLRHGVNAWLARKVWWRSAALLAVASAALIVVLTPARPLWPAATVLARLRSRWPQSTQLARANEVFSVYRARNDLLGSLRDFLPATAVNVGVVADEDDSAYALWRPFGARTLTYLGSSRPWKEETHGITWIVGKTSLLDSRFQRSLEQIRLSSGGQVVTTQLITSKVRDGPEQWFVMRLPEDAGDRADDSQAGRE